MELNLIHRIVDTVTGEVIERPYNEAELAELKVYEQENARIAAELKSKREARQALLNRLGITEEEAKLLLS